MHKILKENEEKEKRERPTKRRKKCEGRNTVRGKRG